MRNILFVFVLLLPGFCFAQEFQSVVGGSAFYPLSSGSFIPPDGNYAVLEVKFEPRGTNNIVSVAILPRVYMSDVQPFQIHALGWHTFSGLSESEGSYGIIYSVISADTIYTWSSAYPTLYLNQIQTILSSMGLGTVSQRQAYINSFAGSPVQIISPSDIYAGFLNLFGPYANIFIGVFLTLFVVDLMTRKTKATVAESAKVARAAERREINQQIKNDTTAQVYKYRLSNLAGIKSGRIQDSEISQSQARRMFRETAEEYAEYRRSRGWVY